MADPVQPTAPVAAPSAGSAPASAPAASPTPAAVVETPPQAAPPTQAAPAVSSPVPAPVETPAASTNVVPQETKPEAVVEPAKAPEAPKPPEPPKTLLAEAGKKPEEPKAPEAPKEPEAPKAPEPVKYEAFKLPEGVELDQKALEPYTELLGKSQVPQEVAQQLVDRYIADQQKLVEAQWENFRKTNDKWVQEAKDDPEIGGNRFETTLAKAGQVLELYGKKFGAEHEKTLRDAFNITGAGSHPEVLRFINWAASFATETSKAIPAPRPAPAPVGKAQRRYAGSITQPNGAA